MTCFIFLLALAFHATDGDDDPLPLNQNVRPYLRKETA